jgi:hypothetical protein
MGTFGHSKDPDRGDFENKMVDRHKGRVALPASEAKTE